MAVSLLICLKIAAYEAKVLFRSWGFRIFALLGLVVLGLLTAWIAVPSYSVPYYFRSVSGSIPLFVFKLFNIFQGLIVIFLATEFFKGVGVVPEIEDAVFKFDVVAG